MTWTAHVLTILPEMFPGPLGHSLAGRAAARGDWRLEVSDIRSFAQDRHRSNDRVQAARDGRRQPGLATVEHQAPTLCTASCDKNTASSASAACGAKSTTPSSATNSAIEASTTRSVRSASSGLSELPSFARRQKRWIATSTSGVSSARPVAREPKIAWA